MQKQPLQKLWRPGAILLMLGGLAIVLAACGTPAPKPAAVAQAPEWDGVLIHLVFGTATPSPTPDAYDIAAATAFAKTPSPVPGVIPTKSQSSASAGNVQPGNAARGAQVFQGIGTCSTCHDTTMNVVITGPSLKGVASRAGQRKPPLSAEDYIRESIKTPNAFVVPNFQPNIMPQNFSQALNAQQLEDLVAFLMTLK